MYIDVCCVLVFLRLSNSESNRDESIPNVFVRSGIWKVKKFEASYDARDIRRLIITAVIPTVD